MSVYRYYIPKKRPPEINDDLLESLGLSERLRDCPLSTKGRRIEVHDILANGPDGSSGSLVTPLRADQQPVPVFRPGRFDSHKSEHGGYWIVWDREDPPGPEGLRRCETVGGVIEELGDGRLWECPTIRTCVHAPRIPQTYSRMNGKVTATHLPEYDAIWQASAGWAVRLLEEYRNIPVVHLLGLDGAWDACVMCLAVNYRVSDEELSLLRLLNDSAMDRIIDAAVDAEWLADVGDDQKKNGTLVGRFARFAEFTAWCRGIYGGYHASRADLELLRLGHGERNPVAVVGMPVKNNG